MWVTEADAGDLPGIAAENPNLQEGDLAYVTGDNTLYVCTDPSYPATWVAVGGGAPTATLEQTYNFGDPADNAISIQATDGPLKLFNDTDATHLLTMTRTFVGAGHAVAVVLETGTTGNALDITLDTGGTGSGVDISHASAGYGIRIVSDVLSESDSLFIDNDGGGGNALRVQVSSTTAFVVTSVGDVIVTPPATRDFTVATTTGVIDLTGGIGGLTIATADDDGTGDITISTGDSTNASAVGLLQILGGAGFDTGAGGSIDIIAGDGGNTDGDGGSVGFLAGDGGLNNGSGGNAILHAGAANGSGTQGLVQITTDAYVQGGINAQQALLLDPDTGLVGAASLFLVDGDPNANVADGGPGSLGLRTDGSAWLKTANPSTWLRLLTTADSGGTPGLQTVYDTGGDNSVLITTADGPISLSDATDATNLLELSRTFTGAGKALSVVMGSTTTGNGIDVVGGGAGKGLLVTGANSVFTGPLVHIDGGACGVGATALRIDSSSGNMSFAQDIQVSSNAVGLRIDTSGAGDLLLVRPGGVAALTVQADRDVLVAGGSISITGGSTNPGKDVTIAAGAALSGDNNGGDLFLDAGDNSGSGIKGDIFVGASNAKSITTGNSSDYPLLDHTGSIVARPAGATDTIDYATGFSINPSTLVTANVSVIVCEGNPNGNIDAPGKGSLAVDVSSSPPKLYQKDADSASTVWHEVGSGAAGALQTTPISAARALPNNVYETWWTCNGHVIIYGLVMEVVTQIQSSTANAKFAIDPPASTEKDYNTAIDMNGWAVGRSWTPIGDGTTTEESSGVGSPRLFVTPEVGLDTSLIKVHNGSNVTGTVIGYVIWSALESGATITANV